MNGCWQTVTVVKDSMGANVTNCIESVAFVELIVRVPRSPPSSTGNTAVSVALFPSVDWNADGCGWNDIVRAGRSAVNPAKADSV